MMDGLEVTAAVEVAALETNLVLESSTTLLPRPPTALQAARTFENAIDPST
jgi:hypothetical protein